MQYRDGVDSVVASFERVRGDAFAREFYQRFLATDAEVGRRFAATDFERQRELFLHGLFALIDFARGRALGELAVRRLARSHGPNQLDVPGRLYGLWLRSLLETLANTDPGWTPDLERAWRSALEPGMRAVRAG